jgi:PAS domain S-box-containing protein
MKNDMGNDSKAILDIIRTNIKALIKTFPQRDEERETWSERFVQSLERPISDLFDHCSDLEEQNDHLMSANDVLRAENEDLRTRLAGRVAVVEAVGQQAEAFRTLAENSPDVIIRLDQALCQIYVNPAAEKMTGLSRDQLIGRPLLSLEVYRPLFLLEADLRQCFINHQEIRQEVVYRSPELVRWFDLRIVPEEGAGGNVRTVLVVAREITERKTYERELAYRAQLLQNVHDAIIAFDDQLRITSWNRAAELLYGWKEPEVLGMSICEVIPNSLPDSFLEQVSAYINDFFQFEIQQMTRSGDLIWVEVQGLPIRDESGQVKGFVETNRDISTRHMLEEENSHQKELLNSIFEINPGGIALVRGADLVYQMANLSYRKITPQPEKEIIGKKVSEVWTGDEGKQTSWMIGHVLHQGAGETFERVTLRYSAGETRYFTAHVQPLLWKGQLSVLLVFWETTELDEALAEMHRRALETEESRRLLEALMEYIPEGIVIASDENQKVRFVSNYFAGMGDYQREQLEGKSLDEYAHLLKLYRADGGPPLTSSELPLVRVSRNGEIIQDREYVFDQDGFQYHLLTNAAPIRDAEGKVFASVMVSRDITERKRSEANQQFLGELGRALVTLRSPSAVISGIVARLGSHLELSRCFMAEESTHTQAWTIYPDFHRGVPSLSGDRQVRFPDLMIERLRQGKPVVIADLKSDPLTSERYADYFAPIKIRSLAAMPLLDPDGTIIRMLVIARREMHSWRPDELALLGSVIDLSVLALENATFFQNLREFRHRFEIALVNLPISVYSIDQKMQITWSFSPHPNGDVLGLVADPTFENALHDSRSPIFQLIRLTLDTGVSNHQEVVLHQTEMPKYVDVSIEPLQDGDGNITGVTLVALDTTERRKMEAEAVVNQSRIEVQRRLIAERELERTRIARELHDGPLQDMIAVKFNLVDAVDINEKEQRMAKIRSIQTMLQKQINDLRRFCNDLRPPVLAPFGLEKTIRSHAEGLFDLYPELSLALNLDEDGQRLSESTRMTLFRVYQELINNVIRHANATQILVEFHLEENKALLSVEDNGVGFDAPEDWVELARSGHLGLVGVQERVQMVGGDVNIVPVPGKGTRINVEVPLA